MKPLTRIEIFILLIVILLTIMTFGSTDPTCTEEKRLKETPETHQRWVNLPDKSHCNLEV